MRETRAIESYFVFKKINILHQNISGLISKCELLTVHLDELERDDVSVDVICVTEHNMMQGDENQLCIPNFQLASCYSRMSRKGGSCILVRNKHKSKDLDGLRRFNIPNTLECSAIELVNHNIIIMCIYRIPKYHLTDLNPFFDNLYDILQEYACNNKYLIIVGDFNINTLKVSPMSKRFQQLILSFNLKISIKEPTRLSSGTCLDNIIHNIRGAESQVHEFALSDHTAQILKCPVKKTSSLGHWYTMKRDYSLENMFKFKEHLSKLGFADVYNTSDPNDAFDRFSDIFKLLYDLCFPKIRVKISSKRRPKWITKGIIKCSKRKRELLWQYRRRPNAENRNTYKSYSQRLHKIIKLTQKSQNNYYIQSSQNKSKATWNIINSTKPNHPRDQIEQIEHNGDKIKNPTDIAKAFNNHFTIPEPLDNTRSNHPLKSTLTYNKLNSMYLSPTNPIDITRIIMTLKNTSSTGYDEICTKVLKYVVHNISVVISYIVNLCIEFGTYPNALKTSIIKPLFKKEDKENMNFYRPIALIPVFSKVFEKVIYNALYNYFEKNDILVPEQKGFRKHKTINLAIYDFIGKIVFNLDNKIPVSAIYMDMTKAFDYVNHKILLQKLHTYGVRGNVIDLIKSYLSDRKQITQIQRLCGQSNMEQIYSSEPSKVTLGVPQGSVLGPLLFLIYINDIVDSTSNPMILFADDSTVVYKNVSNDNLIFENEINNSLNDIITWLQHNNLKINLKKTYIMNFKQIKERIPLTIKHDDNNIDEVPSTKFLGLQIDNKLNWKEQIENVSKKLNRFSYALYMLRKVVDVTAVLTAYHGYVVSTLRYGIIFWGNGINREIAFKSQKKCIRAIFSLKRTDSCKPYFKRHKLLTMPSLYIYEIIMFIKINPTLFENLKSRRNNKNIRATRHKTALFSNSVFGMASTIYNKVPVSIMNIDNPNKFKLRLKDYLADKAYYSVGEYLA